MMKGIISYLFVIFIFVIQCERIEDEDSVRGFDHVEVIRGLDEETLADGLNIYAISCMSCHGDDGSGAQPAASSFTSDELKFGSDPYNMWLVLTDGAGAMAPQTWLSPEERYHVIQYIREEFLKPRNPDQYFDVTEEYLATLPEPGEFDEERLDEIRDGAFAGLQEHGQEWFGENLGDYGTTTYSQLQNRTNAALTIKLADSVYISYNLLRMEIVAAWQGNFDLSRTQYQLYRWGRQPAVDGKTFTGLDTWQWDYSNRKDLVDQEISPRQPLPEELMAFHGHYKHGKNTVISYSIMDRNILEYPQIVHDKNQNILSHTLQIGPDNTPDKLYIGKIEAKTEHQIHNGIIRIGDDLSAFQGASASVEGNLAVTSILNEDKSGNGEIVATGIIGDTDGFEWSVDEQNRIVLTIPASNRPRLVRVFRLSVNSQDYLQDFGDLVNRYSDADDIPNIQELTRGGDAEWGQKVTTTGYLDVGRPHYDPIYYREEDFRSKLISMPDQYPYAVDELTLPFENPWGSWIRPTALDFLSDGRMIMTTLLGDVWMVSGIDENLASITWQRIATGLYEPMGVKIVDDQIYVNGRDRILRLRDLNGNGEIDFYENFYSDQDVSDFWHAYSFDLETDSEGNFYYAKAGQYTDNKDPGNVIKVSPDGRRSESIATGFRIPNGIAISPDDKIFATDNEGNWMPANKISHIRDNEFYGYVQNIVTQGYSPDGIEVEFEGGSFFLGPEVVPVPDTFTKPVVWMPQEFDNSPGGGVWSDADWGPLGDRFIHTSYGKGWLYYLMKQEVNGVLQGALVALPFQLDSGVQRVRVNPADQQIYTVGLTGWDDAFATKYGVLNRVRYTGGEGHFIDDVKIRNEGVEVTFNFQPDKATSTSIENYDVAQWNYMWRQTYGSAKWSVENPFRQGPDKLTVSNVRLVNNGYSILLEIPEIQPVDQLRIRLDLEASDGTKFQDSIYLTIHNIPSE